LRRLTGGASNVANPQKNKGSAAEREVAVILNEELGLSTRRSLGAGRKDDVGDIHGFPNTIAQVAAYASLDRAVREKLPDVEVQMRNAGAEYGALWCRRRGGSFVVVLSPAMYLKMWRDCQ
jgi:hypothetical protein